MGEVWKAKDHELDRIIALKFLPETASLDDERIQRFELEVKALASLNHPNIATIYAMERIQSRLAYAMEYVPGEDLSHYCGGNKLALKLKLDLMRQVACALEEAHERGIVHRDIKPSNIRVSDQHVVKVIDFGLAKFKPMSESQVISDATTQTQLATAAGTVLGTVAYMSPEQVRGEPVDKRCDIWAFGCVLYELFSGVRPFKGVSIGETMATILTQDPEWSLVQAPQAICSLMKRCLERDPKMRLRDMGEARVLLLRFALEEEPKEQIQRRLSNPFWRWAWVPLLLVAFVLGWVFRPSSTPAKEGVRMLEVALPVDTTLSFDTRPGVALSPDGTRLAFVSVKNNQAWLYWHSQETGETKIVKNSQGATGPFFGPENDKVYFQIDNGTLFCADLDLDLSTQVGVLSPATRGVCVTGTGIVFAMSKASGLSQLVPGEITSKQLVPLDNQQGEIGLSWPSFIFDDHVLVTVRHKDDDNFEQAHLAVVSLKTGRRQTVINNAYHGRYLEAGYILFIRSNKLFAVPFDERRCEVRGPEVLVVDNVACDPISGDAQYSLSKGSTLAYVAGNPESSCSLVEIDRSGSTRLILASRQTLAWPRVSLDGTSIAFSAFKFDDDIWTYDLKRRVQKRLTFGGRNVNPCWFFDGHTLAYSIVDPIPKVMKLDISSLESESVPGLRGPAFPLCFLKDQTLLAQVWDPYSSTDLIAIGGSDLKVRPIVQGRFDESNGRISPNEKWLAFDSDQSGEKEVFLRGLGFRRTWST